MIGNQQFTIHHRNREFTFTLRLNLQNRIIPENLISATWGFAFCIYMLFWWGILYQLTVIYYSLCNSRSGTVSLYSIGQELYNEMITVLSSKEKKTNRMPKIRERIYWCISNSPMRLPPENLADILCFTRMNWIFVRRIYTRHKSSLIILVIL